MIFIIYLLNKHYDPNTKEFLEQKKNISKYSNNLGRLLMSKNENEKAETWLKKAKDNLD